MCSESLSQGEAEPTPRKCWLSGSGCGPWTVSSAVPSGGLRPHGHSNGRLFLRQVRYTGGGGSPSTSLRTCPGEELEQAGTLVLRTASRAP